MSTKDTSTIQLSAMKSRVYGGTDENGPVEVCLRVLRTMLNSIVTLAFDSRQPSNAKGIAPSNSIDGLLRQKNCELRPTVVNFDSTFSMESAHVG
jgi:hypothetical protein